jgi:chitosanase
MLDATRRRWRWTVLWLVAGLVLAACSAGTPPPAPTVSGRPAGSAGTVSLTDPQTKMRAARVISTFENSTTDIQYGYAENIADGRGITAGLVGFTSRTGDLYEVVGRYARQRPDSPLAGYLPALEEVNGSDSTEGLDGFADIWKQTSQTDPLLNRIQDQVADELYFRPAMTLAQQVGVRSALGELIIWDTAVQHGGGDPNGDPDGLPAITNEVVAQHGNVTGDEAAWLAEFLRVRRAHLMDPADESTRDAWRASVSRVDALQSILDSGNLDLRPPLAWDVYGDHFTLDD